MTEVYSHLALPMDTMIQEYRIVRVLGSGSFGIVYAAENKYFPETVAIKEFLPRDLACRKEDGTVLPLSSETEKPYRWALHKFIEEARILWELAKKRHRSILRVTRLHEENGTAYMVMDYEKGRPLSQALLEQGTLSEEELKTILEPLLEGLERVHAASVWHRDIKPDNILIRSDGSPVLIDFGAARREVAGAARSLMNIFSPAYAAPEQVFPAAGEQGPWTDIYGLGATLYRAVSGNKPTNASDRLRAVAYEPAARVAEGNYTPTFLAAIDAALELKTVDRPQSIIEWRQLLEKEQEPTATHSDEATVLRPYPDEARNSIAFPVEESVIPPPSSETRPPVEELGGPLPADQRLERIGVHPSVSEAPSIPEKPTERGSSHRKRKRLSLLMFSLVVVVVAIGFAVYRSPNGPKGSDPNGSNKKAASPKLPPGAVNFKAFYYNEGVRRALTNGVTLTSEDHYYLEFNFESKLYLYVAQIDTAGAMHRLFPNVDYSSIGNPLQPGIKYSFPEEDYFFLDSRTGKERLYVVASKSPLRELEGTYKVNDFREVFDREGLDHAMSLWFWHK